MSRIYYFHITPNFTFLLGKAEFLNCPLFLYRRLRPHEAHLSTVALSNVESSRTIGQILHDMNDMKELQPIDQIYLAHQLFEDGKISEGFSQV